MLDKILSHKRADLGKMDLDHEIDRMSRNVSDLSPVRSLAESLTEHVDISLIAEIKRQSPSKGLLARDLDVEKTSGLYEKAGAAAISVLTEEEFFRGSIEDLKTARACSRLPVLRKDFILEEFQVWESKFVGADAILLIVAILCPEKLRSLHSLARQIGLEVLVEIHNESELQEALELNPEMVGINNRNLENFEVNLEVTERLRPLLPRDVVSISESGIYKREDVLRMQDLGIDAVLVGEAIVKNPDPCLKIQELLGRGR